MRRIPLRVINDLPGCADRNDRWLVRNPSRLLEPAGRTRVYSNTATISVSNLWQGIYWVPKYLVFLGSRIVRSNRIIVGGGSKPYLLVLPSRTIVF